METTRTQKLVPVLEKLETSHELTIEQASHKDAMEELISQYLEPPREELQCPHCESTKLVLWGKRNNLQRYRCKDCKRTFNCLTGTPLAHLRHKEQWQEYVQCLKKGLSIRKAAAICGIHPNTAFTWRHRFLKKEK